MQETANHDDNPSELFVLDKQDDDDIPWVNTTTVIPHSSNDLNTTENAIYKWKLDLERIAPQLRIGVVAEANDWRLHLDHAKKLYEDSFSKFNTGKTRFKKLEEDIRASLEKLETHENFVNQEFEPLIAEYMAVKGRLLGLEEKRYRVKEEVAKLTSENAKTLEVLEQVKQKMVEKGNEIADLSPMLHMKAATQKLTTELRDMEVQIGVLEHSLLQAQAKHAVEEAKA